MPDWDEMEPIDRDKLVSREVFSEYKYALSRHCEERGNPEGCPMPKRCSHGHHRGRPERDGTSRVREIPEYTTDISAAWRVVEEMGKEGNIRFLETLDSDEPVWLFNEEDAARKICYAALVAKGVDV